MNSIHDFFKKHHVEEKDIPVAFVLYKSLGLIIAASTFTICYKYKPIQSNINNFPLNLLTNGLKNNFPNFFTKAGSIIENKTLLISNSKYFKPIPDFFKLDSKRTTIAIGETFIIREILTPITVPFKFWVTVNWMKNKNRKINLMEGTKDTIGIIKSKKIKN